MAVPKELTRFERWRCQLALESESRGPLVARALPLFECGMAVGVLALAIHNMTPETMVSNTLGAALAGAFIGLAAQDLLWPRNQRTLALLYRACLEGESERADPS